MIDKQKMAEVINSAIQGTDLFLVAITVSADNVVEVTIDSMQSVDLDDCVLVNDAVLAAFDRDVEDFELTVGSYGISDPFIVPQHYQKNLGGEVEVLLRKGVKFNATLTAATDTEVTLTVAKKIKPEGAKRPVMTDVQEVYPIADIKTIKNIIKF